MNFARRAIRYEMGRGSVAMVLRLYLRLQLLWFMVWAVSDLFFVWYRSGRICGLGAHQYFGRWFLAWLFTQKLPLYFLSLPYHGHRYTIGSMYAFLIEQELTARLEQAAKKELSYADFLDQLLACEIDSKTHKHHQMRITMARFPFQKTLENFDFKFQPSVDLKLVRELATGRYIQSGDNVLFLGPPGVGKTHLAVALGMKACEQGVRTLFITATALITTLGKALAEGRLEERLKLLSQPQLLICDEIGYLPIDRQGANLFFQLVSRRYERGSIIITSNQSLGAWGEVFGDPIIASAILDRLLHHSITINIKGESFRLKEKRRAGLLDKSAPTDPGQTSAP